MDGGEESGAITRLFVVCLTVIALLVIPRPAGISKVSPTGSAHAAYPGASRLTVASQVCTADGRVSVTFVWDASVRGTQWVDISLYDNDFSAGTFLGGAPLADWRASFTWNGLLPGLLHYARVNTFVDGQNWSPSETSAFPTRSDCTSTLPCPSYGPLAGLRDASYLVEGRTVTLFNGIFEVEAAPGSASRMTTRFFGNEASGDLNSDGFADTAFLLTHQTGGSGTFFYVVVALGSSSGYVGTNAVLLGDRIAPQTTEIRGRDIIVNYAERLPGEPFTTAPSRGVTKRLQLQNCRLVEA